MSQLESDLNLKCSKASSSTPKPTCLICGEKIKPSSESHLPNFVELVTELFNVLCKCMHWKVPGSKDFEFSKEVFPFCKTCRSSLVDIFNLNSQLETILQQLNKLRANVSATIISTQERMDANWILGQKQESDITETGEKTEDFGDQLYNSEKVEYFRGLSLRRFSPLVSLNRDSVNCAKNATQSHSGSESNAMLVEPDLGEKSKEILQNSQSSSENHGPNIEDFDLGSMMSDRSRQKPSSLKAFQCVFYERTVLGLAKARDVWTCLGCHRQFRNYDQRNMQRHVMNKCPVFVQDTPNKTVGRGKSRKFVEEASEGDEIPLPVRELIIQHWKGELSGVKTTEEISRLTNVAASNVLEIIQRYKEKGTLEDIVEETAASGGSSPSHSESAWNPSSDGDFIPEKNPPFQAGKDPQIIHVPPNAQTGGPERPAVDNDCNIISDSRTDSDFNFQWKGMLENQVREVGPNKYIYLEKFLFEQINPYNWLCYYCGKYFNHRLYLEVHLMMGCRGRVDGQVQSSDPGQPKPHPKPKELEHRGPAVKDLSWSQLMKKRTEKIGNFLYLFDNKTRMRLTIHSGIHNWTCVSCHKRNGFDSDIERHVMNGCNGEEIRIIEEIDNSHFQYKGFGFHKQDNGHFKCDHCYYDAKTKMRLVDHIISIHLRQLKIAAMVTQPGTSSSSIIQSVIPAESEKQDPTSTTPIGKDVRRNETIPEVQEPSTTTVTVNNTVIKSEYFDVEEVEPMETT